MTSDSSLESRERDWFPVADATWAVAVVLTASFGFLAAVLDVVLAAYVHIWIGVTLLIVQAAIGSIVVARSSRARGRGVGLGLAVTAALGLVWMVAGALGAFG